MKVASILKGTKWALGFVMMVFGLLVTIQIRMSQQASADPGRLRANELTSELKAVEARLANSESERQRLQEELTTLQQSNQNPSAPPPATPVRDTKLELMAGTVAMQGPGVAVTVSEMGPEKNTAVKVAVADEDLWRVVNELLAAGAEGIAVGGERLTSISAIRNVDRRIMVNQKMVVSPVIIEAVGDPVVLEAAIRLRGGVIDVEARWGIKVTVQRHDAITLPAYNLTPTFRHGKPAN